ncbi:DoxX family protein [Candidatus Woesebacteria bacterium]|nr:DoxX family protein [Candidatus Woesebacteria bacterium]
MYNHKKITLVLLRVFLGILFLSSGISKFTSNFSAESYLLHATSGPFVHFFAQMAGNPLVDFLVIYGEIGIGAALLLGVCVRFASAMGVLMMALFYFSAFPPEHGLVSEHIIYCLSFVMLASQGAGRLLGLDSYLERGTMIKKHFNVFRFLLG